jgi:nicotinamidase-related amidase
VRRRSGPVRLAVSSTAIAVLDLGRRCTEPAEVCTRLIPGVGVFLETARAAGVPIAFTNTARLRSSPDGELAPGLHRRPGEPILFPDHYDKFHGGELEAFLGRSGATTLVLCGSSTNVCVLYTATTAMRRLGLQVVIPLDGVNARTSYLHGYALHQLANLGVSSLIRFTTLRQVTWTGTADGGEASVPPATASPR